jgi:hypothetical protein
MKQLFIALISLTFMLLGIVQITKATNSSTNGVNLLTNPSFENWTGGSPDGWTIVYPLNGTVSENTNFVTNGSKSLKLTGGTGTYTINQVIPVVAGKTYHLQMKYYIETGDGTDARIWCNFKNNSGVYWKMTTIDSLALKGPNATMTGGYFPDVKGSWQTYSYAVVAPAGYEFFNFEFRTYRSPAVVYWDDMSFSEAVSGIITSTEQLSGFQYAPGNGPSSVQSFTVSGMDLTSGITVTAPTNYEISALSGNDFSGTTSMNIPASNGTVSPLTLYVRLKSGLMENTYNGNITVSSTGLTSKLIALSGKVETPPAVVTLSIDSLKNFQYDYGRGPSAEKSFTLNASNLSNGITITVPTAYEISVLSGSSFSGTNSLTIPHTNGLISNLTLYVRMKFGLTVNNYIGDMTFATNGSATKVISLTGNVNIAPAVVASSVTTLSGFNYNFGTGPSYSQNFTVSGVGLTQNLALTAPAGYELSSDYGATYSSSLSFVQSGGVVSTRTVYIRLKSGLSVQSYNGNVAVTSTGAVNQINISLNGSVTLPAGISVSSTSISGFDYVAESGPSLIKAFIVEGGSLSQFLIITAPTDFEISTADGSSFVGSGQILLQTVNGSVTDTIYVRLRAGLDVNSYSGNITLSSSGHTSKYIALSGVVNLPQNIISDNFYYESKNGGRLNFRNKWLISNRLNNYNVSTDLIAPAGTARGMAVKDGKMLFIDRANKQIVRVAGSTGAKLSPLPLASNLFTYLGRNKANTADSIWTAGIFGFNDIKVDNVGNVLVGNLINSNTARFQIYKINMNDGSGTLVIDQTNLATLFPTATTLRFDYFNVIGDVNNNATILAANASISAMEVYKWTITNGVPSDPIVIPLDNSLATGKDLSGLVNLGSGPQVFPVDNNKFYVDGNATYPVLCDMNGNVLDGFKSNLNNLKDSTTMPGLYYTMNPGHNGMKEFQVGNEHFIVMAATNTVGIPASTFRLFKFADASKSFASMDCLWTFPQQGMGAASNAYRLAMPNVEVNGNTAKIYVYVGENGYGMYELTTDGTWTNEKKFSAKSDKVLVSFENNKISLSEEVKQLEVYNISGQKVLSRNNINYSETALKQGIYIVRIITENGIKQAEKIFVR